MEYEYLASMAMPSIMLSITTKSAPLKRRLCLSSIIRIRNAFWSKVSEYQYSSSGLPFLYGPHAVLYNYRLYGTPDKVIPMDLVEASVDGTCLCWQKPKTKTVTQFE
jgi:hypothetical protein